MKFRRITVFNMIFLLGGLLLPALFHDKTPQEKALKKGKF